MLSLSVVFLAAAIALWAQPASAEDICPMGNLTRDEISFNTPGMHYSAASCTFIDLVFLYLQDIPVNTSAIQVTVESSVVSEGSLLGVQFDSSCSSKYDENGDLLHIAPVAVTIKNNLFRLNAVFYFSGCLPPNATLTFQSNVMSANTTNYWLEASSIHFIYSDRLSMLSGSSFNILDNTMTALNVTGDRDIRGLYFYRCYAYANSTVNIQRNTITVNGSGVYGAIIYLNELLVESNSTLRIEDNTMTVNTTSTVEAIYMYSTYGDPSGLVSISRNLLNIKSEYTNDYVMFLPYIQEVNLQLDNNDISYNYDYFIYAYQFYYSSVSISGNALDYTNATATAPFISIDEYYFGNSTATIANNMVTGPSVFTNTSLFLQVGSVSNESASIVHCGNTLPWAASPTAEQFVSAELIPLLVYNADVCTVASTTLVATSTSVTTTASGGTTAAQNMTTLDAGATTSVSARSTTPAKSASAAAYLGHAAVACLVALAASLL